MNTKNKTYNATDFANYHAGKMPAAEMHALERAALEDDFLADALEGYAYTENHEAEIAIIDEKIKGENKDDIAKIIPIAKAKNNWLRMVAAAAIVLGLGTLFYNINNKNEAANIAKVETKANNVTDSIVQQTEANKTINEVAAAPAEKVFAAKEKVFADINIGTLDQTTTAPQIIMPQAPIVVADAKTNTTNGNTTFYNYNTTQNNGIFQNNIDSKTGGPKQLANIKNTNSGLSNNNGGFGNNTLANNGNYRLDDRDKFKALTRTDSTSFPIAMNDKVMDKEQAASPAPVAPAAKPQAEAKLEEVVVTGYGETAKKRKAVTSAVAPVKAKDIASANTSADLDNALQGRVSGLKIETAKKGEVDLIKLQKMTTSSLDAFNNYVKKNIKPVFDDKGNEIKGTVKLSFKTNKAGEPIKIKTTQSLTKKADAQAIELLKKATTWPPNKSDRIVVDVVF
jgi:hypothetical protein